MMGFAKGSTHLTGYELNFFEVISAAFLWIESVKFNKINN
jgi:hypothetical protein